jgi:exodeoxyribonuclease V alpha subunit
MASPVREERALSIPSDEVLVKPGRKSEVAGAMPHGDRHAADVEPFTLRPPGPASERLSGLVERVVFHNPATGFCVLRVKLAEQREPATFVGECAQVAPGEVVRAEGSWQTSPSFGPQFRTRAIAVVPPSTTEGMEAYLASGMIKGIGRGFAKRLVEAFGDQVFEVIERQPERLRDVPGIGRGLAQRIAKAWNEQKAVRDIMLYLHAHGISPLRAARIHEAYGDRAIEVVSANPYRLAQDIRGIGFASADELAARLGIPRDSPFRLRAGLSHVLEEALGQGHCGMPRAELAEQAAALLGVDAAQVEQAIDAASAARALIADRVDGTGCLFLPAIHQAEDEIADALRSLGGRPKWAIADPDARVAEVERELGLRLAEGQRAALRLALVSKLLIITGGPGTGKTTLVEAILAGLGRKVEIALAAPTGRAARRLGESTGREAKTLHRLLEAEPGRGFRRGPERPLACDLLVVDEMSMVDVPLMQAMLAALPEDAGLLLVGDADQLPSVGPGQVLADLIASAQLAVIRLDEVFRQAAQSQIVRNAHRINQGEMPELARDEGELSDFYAIKARGPEDGARLVLELVSERIPARFGVSALTDIQVLCPTNRGELGARHLNQTLQARLNPDAADRVERHGVTFVLGDKVMQLENDYEREVYNGDLGRITGIDHAQSQVQVEIDARPLTYDFSELDRLVPAYAITVHKAQGSEYPAVVLPLARQHGRMLRRNLVYTAITRAKRLVVLVVEGDALELAIAGRPEPRRWSRLRALLRAGRDETAAPT